MRICSKVPPKQMHQLQASHICRILKTHHTVSIVPLANSSAKASLIAKWFRVRLPRFCTNFFSRMNRVSKIFSITTKPWPCRSRTFSSWIISKNSHFNSIFLDESLNSSPTITDDCMCNGIFDISSLKSEDLSLRPSRFAHSHLPNPISNSISIPISIPITITISIAIGSIRVVSLLLIISRQRVVKSLQQIYNCS